LSFQDKSFEVVFNVNMAHWIDDPIIMLNEINRILKPDGNLFIRDLRHSWLKIFEDEIRYAFNLNEAENLIKKSDLKKGNFSSSLLW